MTVGLMAVAFLVGLLLGAAIHKAGGESARVEAANAHPYHRTCPCNHDAVFHSMTKCAVSGCVCQRTAGEVVALLENDRPR